MFENYLKSAWRNIKRSKGFFALNFIGLYISIAVCLLIGLIILHETSFDRSTNKNLVIYRVVKSATRSTGKTYSAITPYPLAAALRATTSMKLISQIHFQREDVISFDNKKFKEENIVFADSVFPRLFPLTVKQGSIGRALTEPGFAIVTEETAHKFFGNENPIGKRVKIANLVDLQVAAVIANAPANSHLQYNMLISYPSLKPEFIGGFPLDQWGLNSAGYTYIGLPDENQTGHVNAALASIANENLNNKKDGTITNFNLQPLPDIHYNQLYAGGNPSYTINYSYLYLIGAIGLFLILAACINYTNLSTALAIRKSKEVGVRKTMGATREHLLRQFLSETFVLTAFVFIAAALSVRFFLPPLNNFLDKNIPLNWLHVNSALFLIGLWILVSLLSGLYPAFVLSGFNPVAALKNKGITPKASVVTLRKGLVVFQFLTAQILLIGAIVVAKQMNFIQSRPLGFTTNNVVDINLPENKHEQLKLLSDKLSAIPGVTGVSFSLGAPVADNNASTSFNRKEKYASEKIDVEVKAADKNYLSTYGLQLTAGRWFDDNDEHSVNDAIP
ncbi:MAG TPA: ABC transporter permease, partial [Parafilimonas sp.]|nr:ABC transporter permease [Parafilimonas sp.]